MLSRDQILARAISGRRESRSLDFKSAFDPASQADWCEIIKDIVAFANSGGGAIVIGLQDDASPSNFDVSGVLRIDSADVVNRIQRYIGFQFSDFEVLPLDRDGVRLAVILVLGAEVPLIFLKPGTYAVDESRQKTAFAQGTVYFRHGSKSEPGTRDDLVKWRDEEVGRLREEWLGGIRKVVEAPPGHTVHIVAPTQDGREVMSARIGTDETAPMVRLQNPADIFPHRQQDVIHLVNDRISAGKRFNSHDIHCVRRQHNIHPTSRPDFVFKPHPSSAPQYSDRFVEWVVQEIERNDRFVSDARQHFKDGV